MRARERRERGSAAAASTAFCGVQRLGDCGVGGGSEEGAPKVLRSLRRTHTPGVAASGDDDDDDDGGDAVPRWRRWAPYFNTVPPSKPPVQALTGDGGVPPPTPPRPRHVQHTYTLAGA